MRKLLSVFFTVILFIGVALTTAMSPAAARPLTPEASSYEVNQPTTPELGQRQQQETARTNLKKLAGEDIPHQKGMKPSVDDGQNALERAAENVREKLNLDEPVPQSTKDFLHDVQETVEDINPFDAR